MIRRWDLVLGVAVMIAAPLVGYCAKVALRTEPVVVEARAPAEAERVWPAAVPP